MTFVLTVPFFPNLFCCSATFGFAPHWWFSLCFFVSTFFCLDLLRPIIYTGRGKRSVYHRCTTHLGTGRGLYYADQPGNEHCFSAGEEAQQTTRPSSFTVHVSHRSSSIRCMPVRDCSSIDRSSLCLFYPHPPPIHLCLSSVHPSYVSTCVLLVVYLVPFFVNRFLIV